MDNIFSAIARDRSRGVIAEIVLWGCTCFTVLMALISLIVGEGSIPWIFLLLFSVGTTVIAIFRKEKILMPFNVCAYCLLLPLIHFLCYFNMEKVDILGYSAHPSVVNIILFVVVMMLGIAVSILTFLQCFMRGTNLKLVLQILHYAQAAVLLILQILLFAAAYLGSAAESVNSLQRLYLNSKAYWIGTITYWMLLAIVVVYAVFYLTGFMSSGFGGYTPPVPRPNAKPGLRFTSGAYMGRTYYLQLNETAYIGRAANNSIQLPDTNVSSNHCMIRYNTGIRAYEIMDTSTNGVFIGSGQRLNKNQVTRLQPGTIVSFGSAMQQCILL